MSKDKEASAKRKNSEHAKNNASAKQADNADKTPPATKSGLQKALGIARTVAIYMAIFVVLSFVIGYLRAPSLPDEAPPFQAVGLDGQSYSKASLKGKKVILNFWAPWCGPCRAEIPMIRNYAENHPDVVVLGIAVDGRADSLAASAKELGITYPVVLSPAKVIHDYKASSLPTTVILDEAGQVKLVHVGVITPLQLWWGTL